MTVISEDSRLRRHWDLVVFGLIFISCILIPFQVVFQGKAFGQGAVLIYAIDLFFYLDIWLNFIGHFRPHYSNREIVLL